MQPILVLVLCFSVTLALQLGQTGDFSNTAALGGFYRLECRSCSYVYPPRTYYQWLYPLPEQTMFVRLSTCDILPGIIPFARADHVRTYIRFGLITSDYTLCQSRPCSYVYPPRTYYQRLYRLPLQTMFVRISTCDLLPVTIPLARADHVRTSIHLWLITSDSTLCLRRPFS